MNRQLVVASDLKINKKTFVALLVVDCLLIEFSPFPRLSMQVMGLLLGRPDPVTPTTLVVTDAFALPIEGFETRVIADDETVVNHMIALGESLERTRHEKFMGWYHSHPFDPVPDRSHCFLSQTDLSTQLQWQRAEDPHGNPFVAIVVDPLRSALLEQPQLKAFRAYPPEYQSPVPNECPNGTVEMSEQARLESWGSCWNRYYELDVEYYMSSTSRKVLEQLTQQYLWIRTLHCPAPDANVQALTAAAQQVSVAATSLSNNMSSSASSWSRPPHPPSSPGMSRSMAAGGSSSAASAGGGSAGGESGAPTGGGAGFAYIRAAEQGLVAGADSSTSSAGAALPATTIPPPRQNKEWTKAVQQVVEVASNQVCETNLQKTKEIIFR